MLRCERGRRKEQKIILHHLHLVSQTMIFIFFSPSHLVTLTLSPFFGCVLLSRVVTFKNLKKKSNEYKVNMMPIDS